MQITKSYTDILNAIPLRSDVIAATTTTTFTL
jgi:hypothetical protein